MAPKFKKAKKTRELADRYTAVLAQRSTYTGQLQGAPTYSHHEAPDKHSMGGKNLVLLFEWQGSVEWCCRSSESQMAAVASRSVCKAFCWLCLRICLSTDGLEDAVAGASSVTPFSAENNVPGVSSVV